VEVLVAEEVQLQEKEALLQEKVLVADLEATEFSTREGGFGPRSSSAPRREGGLHQTDQEQKVHLKSTKTFRKLW
jgi:hypothetical protein